MKKAVLRRIKRCCNDSYLGCFPVSVTCGLVEAAALWTKPDSRTCGGEELVGL